MQNLKTASRRVTGAGLKYTSNVNDQAVPRKIDLANSHGARERYRAGGKEKREKPRWRKGETGGKYAPISTIRRKVPTIEARPRSFLVPLIHRFAQLFTTRLPSTATAVGPTPARERGGNNRYRSRYVYYVAFAFAGEIKDFLVSSGPKGRGVNHARAPEFRVGCVTDVRCARSRLE